MCFHRMKLVAIEKTFVKCVIKVIKAKKNANIKNTLYLIAMSFTLWAKQVISNYDMPILMDLFNKKKFFAGQSSSTSDWAFHETDSI